MSRSIRCRDLLVALAWLALLVLASAAAAEGFEAGFAKLAITPPVPDGWTDRDGDGRYDDAADTFSDGNGDGRFARVWMAGFQQGRPAARVNDDLMAVAAVFDDGHRRIGLVSADVIGLSHEFTEALRHDVGEALSLDYLLVHATHNHQGPDTLGLWGPGMLRTGRDETYLVWLRGRMAEALHAASERAQPARLEIADIQGRDRRIGTIDTRPPLVIDDGVRVAVFRGADASVLGTLLNFGNHVELLWDRNLALTADVAGYARRGIDQGLDYDGDLFRAGLGGTTLWLTGNIGGLITTTPETPVLDPRSDDAIREPSFAKARAQGYAIAAAVLDAVAGGSLEGFAAPTLRFVREDLELPLANRLLFLANLLGVVETQRVGFFRPKVVTEVAAIAIGPLWLAAVPGELYPEIAVGGIETPPGADLGGAPVEQPPLRSRMSGRVNMMVNLANDEIGYIIPRSEWDREAPWIYGAADETYGEIVSLGPETAPAIHAALLRVLDRLAEPDTGLPRAGTKTKEP